MERPGDPGWRSQQVLKSNAILQVTFERTLVDSVTPTAMAKQDCMSECLDHLFSDAPSTVPVHAISIGDSDAERLALRAVMGQPGLQESQPETPAERRSQSLGVLPLSEQVSGRSCVSLGLLRGSCKTLKFDDRPSMEQLERQLRALLLWLPRLVEHDSDVELTMDELLQLPSVGSR